MGSQRSTKTLSGPFHEDVLSQSTSLPADLKDAPDLFGHFSYAPATKTTVVTTTTTTTTSFPPLVIKTPNHLHDLDPRLYPLAASPTPSSIKRITFMSGGRSTVFREVDSTAKKSPKVHSPWNLVRSDLTFAERLQVPKTTSEPRRIKRTLRSGARENSTEQVEDIAVKSSKAAPPRQDPQVPDLSRKTWSSTPPVSTTDASDSQIVQSLSEASSQREIPRRRSTSSRQNGMSRLQICQTATPVTPSPALCATAQSSQLLSGLVAGLWTERNTKSPITGSDDAPSQLSTLGGLSQVTGSDSSATIRRPSTISVPLDLGISLHRETDTTMSTPLGALDSTASSSRRPRPTALNTAAIQDASLPSPSLSPVTAAANLQRGGYFGSSHTRVPVQSALSSPPQDFGDGIFSSMSGSLPREALSRPRDITPSRKSSESRPTSFAEQAMAPSMMHIPEMLDTFEAMPDEMKSYVIYQLLRRCPKPVLHFVADVVDPALKCDFLELLPLELSQQIISHLDVKTLCHAAQVSRKWRCIVDSDEKVWKNRFDQKGYVLPPGELHQAISEGWGWQFGSAPHDFEQNIGDLEHFRRSGTWPLAMTGGDRANSVISVTESVVTSSSGKKSKRKAASRTKLASRKQQKKKDSRLSAEIEFDYNALLDHISSADGPYAAAQAASRAVPISQIGLPSLRNLHLYKSLYRRHHLISNNWMQDEIKPRHLAFKAHGRHVVTCLQFDSDKILTGSDDTNINVYDTQTGALRSRLTGHEGGVWALQYVGNTLVSGSTDRSVRVWDIEKGECKHVFAGHTSTVRCLVILMPTEVGRTPKGKRIMMPSEPLIITGSRDSNLRVWRMPRPDEPSFKASSHAADDTDCPFFVRALTGHVHSVRAIAAHADTLVSGSYDFTVRVWKISTGETLHRLTGHTQKVYSVVLDHERNRCISGSMDNLVKVWALDTGSVIYNLEGHSSLVGLLDLYADRLVSAAADYTLRIWDPETGHCRSILNAHTGAITCFQHDARKVISGSDRTLKMWDVKTGGFVRDLLRDLSGVWQVKFDERRCVAAVQRDSQTYLEVNSSLSQPKPTC